MAPKYEGVDVDTFCADLTQRAGVQVDVTPEARRHLASDPLRLELHEVSIAKLLDIYAQTHHSIEWRVENSAVVILTLDEAHEHLRIEREHDKEWQGLQVRWNPPSLHMYMAAREHGSAPPRYIVFSGVVTHLDENGSRIPFSPPAMLVAVAREPDVEIDWSRGAARADSLMIAARADANGEFQVHVDVWKLDRRVGETHCNQVGVLFPAVYGGGPAFPTDPVHPSSIAHVAIPGPLPLSRTLALINSAAPLNPKTYDPIALVRAVNHLYSLGKESAIAALREYMSIAPNIGPGDYLWASGANPDCADSSVIFPIVRLLFDSPDRPRSPEFWAKMLIPRALHDVDAQRDYPFKIVGDIPFVAAQWSGGHTGYDSDPGEAIAWAENAGVLRPTPLHPTNDPIVAAELSGLDARGQAWIALQNVVGIPLSERFQTLQCPCSTACRFDDERSPVSDTAWDRFTNAARAAGLHWDEGRQDYVRTR